MPNKELILEALGWIGLVFMILTVVGILGIIAVAMLFDWEFGFPLMLYGFILISIGIAFALFWYREWLFEKEHLLPPAHIRCPYCGMKNFINAAFCIRCGKALPEQLNAKSETQSSEVERD